MLLHPSSAKNGWKRTKKARAPRSAPSARQPPPRHRACPHSSALRAPWGPGGSGLRRGPASPSPHAAPAGARKLFPHQTVPAPGPSGHPGPAAPEPELLEPGQRWGTHPLSVHTGERRKLPPHSRGCESRYSLAPWASGTAPHTNHLPRSLCGRLRGEKAERERRERGFHFLPLRVWP